MSMRPIHFSGKLQTAFSDTNVTFGLYFSLYEWFNPWYLRDKRNDFQTQEFVKVTFCLETLRRFSLMLLLFGSFETNIINFYIRFRKCLTKS